MCHIHKLPHLVRETPAEVVAEEQGLVEVGHIADGVRNAAMELVVGEGHDRDGGVSDGMWDEGIESVIV